MLDYVTWIPIDGFVMHIKTNDFYKDIANDVENRFDTSNYEVIRQRLVL